VTVGSLLVVGELNPDIVVTGVPAVGGRLRFGQAEDLVDATTLTLGSSAAITASAAAVAGATVGLVGVVGDDLLGRACLDWVAERGVDVSAVRVEPGLATGSSVILVNAADATDRQILTHLGAITELVVQDLPDALIAGHRQLHVSSFFLHRQARHRLHERMARARALGLTVSLDTNDDPARRWDGGVAEAVANSDLLFCNDSEALGLAGLGDAGSPERAVGALLARMPPADADRARAERVSAELPAVVRKLGAQGAEVHTNAGVIRVQAPQVAVVDTVGAGDTLAGTVLARLLAGTDWPAALAHGVAAASLSTRAAGGVAGQPTSVETTVLAATLATG
jgi:sugar/nucleoside kinase (ribokinase family)